MKFATFVTFALLAMAGLAAAQDKPVIPAQYSMATEVFFHDGQKAHTGFGFAFVDHVAGKLAEKALFTLMPNHNQPELSEAHTFHLVADFKKDVAYSVTDGECEVTDAGEEHDIFEFMEEAKFAGRRVRGDGSVVMNWIQIDEITGFTTMASFDANSGFPVEITLTIPQTRIYSTQMIHTWTPVAPAPGSFDKPIECPDQPQPQQPEIYW